MSTDTKWIYDGWRQLAELNATNNLLVRGFTWGLDLGGSLEKAGGIGGLLMFTDGGTSTTHFYAYDGNGNVMALVKATDGTKSADYEYGPFGEVIRISGSAAKANPLRFSTKCQDEETELVYYGYRFYNAAVGRWPNRDPIGEEGGKNLYGFVANTPINAVDQLGLVIVGFYGADISYRWPKWRNELLEEISGIMEMYEKVLRPSSQWRTYPLYHSRADRQAFSDLLRYLDTNEDGYYNPPCDNEETIKIFGWSWGGASAVELANRINDSDKFKKKNVGLVAVIDPVTAFRTGKHTVPSNVYRLWNRYQRNGRNVLPLGLPNHGNQLTIADPGKTIANQQQLDPGGRIEGVDHVSIVDLVAYDFLAEFFQ